MTNFKVVYDRAMGRIQDYRLDNAMNKDENIYYEFMRQRLYEAIDLFTDCLSDLTYHSETVDGITEWYFDSTLSTKEISILGQAVAITWAEWNLNDAKYINAKLNNPSFKATNDANFIKQKSELLDKMKEDMGREIISYQLKNFTSLSFFGGV